MEFFENYKIFIYIILAVLYFLFSGNKKKPAPKNSTPQPQEPVTNKPAMEKSRRSLLKEIKTPGSKQSSNTPEKSPSMEPFSLEEIVREFGGKVDPPVEKKEIYVEDLEDIKPVVVDYEEDYKDEVSSRHTVIDSKDQKEHFEPYDAAHSRPNKYAAMFKDKASLKKVFIAQEIFNRKHF